MEGCQKVKSVVLELSAASGNEAECASVSTLVLGRTGDRIVLIGCAWLNAHLKRIRGFRENLQRRPKMMMIAVMTFDIFLVT